MRTKQKKLPAAVAYEQGKENMDAERDAYVAGFIDGNETMQDHCRSVSQWNGEIPVKELIQMARESFKKCLRSPKPYER